jgi:hypothetical protein
MKKFFLLFLFFFTLFCGPYALAQKKVPVSPYSSSKTSDATRGFTLHLGPSVNYYQGKSSGSFDSFETDRVSWQINGMLGYGFNKNNSAKSNILGVFATGGYTTRGIFDTMLADQGIAVDDLRDSKYYNFYQAEAGMIVAEILRLSTGVGVQQYKTLDSNEERLYYLSSTVGFAFKLSGSINWTIDANFLHGRDFNRTVIRASTGLMVTF